MTSVTFPFFVLPPSEDHKTLSFGDAEFRFGTKHARLLERAAGQGIEWVIARGQAVEALVLLVCYGLLWTNKKMTEDKAIDLIDEFIDAGGDATQLRDACLRALNESGVYGKPKLEDDDNTKTGEGTARP